MTQLGILFFITTILLSAVSHADKQSNDNFNKIFAIIEKNYADGYCDQIAKDPIYSESFKRDALLLAIDDTLGLIAGGSSLAGKWVGNINTFKIGRTTNPEFFNFALYATRADISKIVQLDVKDMRKQIESSLASNIHAMFRATDATKKENQQLIDHLKNENQKLIDHIKDIHTKSLGPSGSIKEEDAETKMLHALYIPILCNEYQIIIDENSAAATQFQEYARSVHKRALNKNLKALQDLMEWLIAGTSTLPQKKHRYSNAA